MLRLIQTCSAASQGGQALKAAVARMVGIVAAIGVIQPLEHKAGGMASVKTLTGKQCRNGLKKLAHLLILADLITALALEMGCVG